MHRLLAAALLVGGCAAGAQGEHAAVPAPAAAPNPPELTVLETEFRAQDRQLGDLLRADQPPNCFLIDLHQQRLGKLTAKICAIATTRDAGRSRPGVPCRYAWERNARLGQQARRLGCDNREPLPVMPSGRLDLPDEAIGPACCSLAGASACSWPRG